MQKSKTKLEFRLEDTKEKHKLGEHVLVRTILKNISDKPITVNGRMAICGFIPKDDGLKDNTWHDCEIKFDVSHISEKIDRLTALINRRPAYADKFKVLNPGEEIVSEQCANFLFVMNKLGEYRVKAFYGNYDSGEEYGLSAWVGVLESNIITLTISH